MSARDVSLALDPPASSSILNILSATVTECGDPRGPQLTLRLSIGDEIPLLARITRKSAENLAIRPGLPLYAQVKSVALLGSTSGEEIAERTKR